jgi:hypothetical protein
LLPGFHIGRNLSSELINKCIFLYKH